MGRIKASVKFQKDSRNHLVKQVLLGGLSSSRGAQSGPDFGSLWKDGWSDCVKEVHCPWQSHEPIENENQRKALRETD